MWQWWKRLLAKDSRDGSGEQRTIYCNDPRGQTDFCDNRISSTKYNVFTFLPLNLWEQFHRPINIYFLIVATLQFIPSVATVSPLTTLLPISVAFLIHAVKDGFDDLRRHRQDAEVNERVYKRLRPGTLEVEEVASADIHVGNILILHSFEKVPSDVLILLSSHDEGGAYITTESLDGETGSKQRFAILNRMFKDSQAAAPFYLPALTSRDDPTSPTPVEDDSHTLGVDASPRLSKGKFTDVPMPDVQRSYETVKHTQLSCLQYVCSSRLVLMSEGPNAHLHSYHGVATVRRPRSSSEYYGTSLPMPAACSDSVDDTSKPGGEARKSARGSPYNLLSASKAPRIFANATSTGRAALGEGRLHLFSGPVGVSLSRRQSEAHTPDYHEGSNISFTDDERRGLLEPGNMVQESTPLHPSSMGPGSDTCDYFDGPEQIIPVGIDNVVYASSRLRSTDFVVALVIFTGRETKMCMTRRVPPTKWATIDHHFNYLTLLIFLIQFILMSVCAIISSVRLKAHSALWYLGGSDRLIKFNEYFPILPLRYLMMLSPMVSLSFKVMVEVSKAYISYVIRWDEDMRFDGEPVSVNNSALAEELGQVEYILSDKTGTLTTNIMTFSALATVGDDVFSASTEHAIAPDQHRPLTEVGKVIRSRAARGQLEDYYLMLTMVFCNTIEEELSPSFSGSSDVMDTATSTQGADNSPSERRSSTRSWISSSPDEVALVEGAERCGFPLRQRSRTHGTVGLWGEAHSSLEVDVVYTLPFSSDRGMMSVLLRCSTVDATSAAAAVHGSVDTTRMGGDDLPVEYVLLIKGADEKVLPCCADNYSSSHLDVIKKRLACFSNEGLRTLVCGYRKLTEEEAMDALRQFAAMEAGFTSKADREVGLQRIYGLLERDVTYCGITAVKDELQKGVLQTIAQLRQANIRVWMLTGDKAETAKQTAVACGLLALTDRVVMLTPPQGDLLTPAEHLAYVSDRLSEVVGFSAHESPAERRAMATRWQEVRRWCRCYLWERSGLEDFVHEFTQPATCERIRPLSHPLTTQPLSTIEDRYGPVSPAVLSMVSVVCGTPCPRPGLSFKPVSAASFCSNKFDPKLGYCVTLSGKTLRLLEEEDFMSKGHSTVVRLFHKCLLEARAVVCSRTTPFHKSYVVNVVRRAGHITLAIGDGGNDVPMLQAAHVGVGVKGREGSEAQLASDFAIGQFCFLSKLLLVHGHTAYQRTAMIVQQSFWKTVLIAWVQVLFNTSTDFSAVSFWDSLSLTLYNAIPTVPVTFLCVMNIPLSHWILCSTTPLYRMSQRGRYLNASTFYGYIARALLHGTIIYYLSLALQRGTGGIIANGWVLDRRGDFYAAYIAIVTVHTYTVWTESHVITVAHWFSFLFSIWSCFLCFWIYAHVPNSSNKTFSVLLTTPSFYLSYLCMLTTVCVSLAVYAIPKSLWFPDGLQLMRLVLVHLRQAREWSHSVPHRALHTFFQEDNPSQFWQSISLYHALRYTPPPRQVFTIPERGEAEA
ncbi:hypothetical protein JKF63_01832 [Porcisia hertigi]|uniref:P-type phospholipid transporter n=1 Tax=Porcisia hertigi TaxID=2761500 RepID=A0A836L0R5_9TRYP|nr:hypothetical protein JKF63_01832 [Porcisia hertigi]